jgi:hypothetical protein
MTILGHKPIAARASGQFTLRTLFGLMATVAVWAILVKPSGPNGEPMIVFCLRSLPPPPGIGPVYKVALRIAVDLVWPFMMAMALSIIAEAILVVVHRCGICWLWCHAAVGAFCVALEFLSFVAPRLPNLILPMIANILLGTWLVSPLLAVFECWLRGSARWERQIAFGGCACAVMLLALIYFGHHSQW